MAKKGSGSNRKKTTPKKKQVKSDDEKLQQEKQEPVEKIKVNRSRRRLYETPAEDEPKSAVKKPTTTKKVSGKKKAKRKSVATNKKPKSKIETVVEEPKNNLPVISQSNGQSQTESKHLNESKRIVEKYSAFASGSVLLPIPGIDVVYITGVQLKMLSDLSKLYDIEFKRNRGKAIVTSLISGIVSNRFIFSTAPFLVRYIPVVGFLMAPLSIVLFSSALTYSVGKVFIQHFEAGGTFLNFKPEEVRAHFREEFEKKYQVMKDDS